MTEWLADQYRRALAVYAEPLAESILARLGKFSRAKLAGDFADRVIKIVSNPKTLPKILAKLSPDEQRSLAILRCIPLLAWRWDQAIRLLEESGVESAYTAIQELLALGLVAMHRPGTDDPLVRFDVVTGGAPESLPRLLVTPFVTEEADEWLPPSPVADRVLDSESAQGLSWRHADGWEWPMRLALLWQHAWLTPIKRTQQAVLFKRDRDRLLQDPLLASAMLDSQAKIPDPGILAYQLAMHQGWLDASSDEQSPTGPLTEIWGGDIDSVLLSCAQGLIQVEAWNELGADAPVGRFPVDIVVSRGIVFFWLRQLGPGEAVSQDALAQALLAVDEPWSGRGEPTGVLRQPEDRERLCGQWLRTFLLGTAYQCGLIEVATREDDTMLRLSPLGRRLVGDSALPIERTEYPQSLLVQPNHQVIVYRQALSIELLAKMVQFAEPRSVGAALTFELTPPSIYHGLESGLSTDDIVELLHQRGGRPVPSGVEDSIRTWSQKRDRLTIYSQAALFEFATPQDLAEAVERGLNGQAVNDRMLLVEETDGAFANLRITASRDYRLEPQPCVEAGPDGVTLAVDREKSDLMLESEIHRFAESLPFTDKDGRTLYRVTRSSVENALDQGLRLEFIEQWFVQRTGKEIPKSVRLLIRAAGGLELASRTITVLSTESPLVADGLLQHPRTAELFLERLGPTALSVDASRMEELRAALEELGVSLRSANRVAGGESPS